MENLVEKFKAAHADLAAAERRQTEAKTALVGLAQRDPSCAEDKFAAARAEVSAAQKAAESARQRVVELRKLASDEQGRMLAEVGELVRQDWESIRQARTRRARLHDLAEAESALIELSNADDGPKLKRRIGTYLGNVIPQGGVFGIDDSTFARAEKEWAEFLARMLV